MRYRDDSDFIPGKGRYTGDVYTIDNLNVNIGRRIKKLGFLGDRLPQNTLGYYLPKTSSPIFDYGMVLHQKMRSTDDLPYHSATWDSPVVYGNGMFVMPENGGHGIHFMTEYFDGQTHETLWEYRRIPSDALTNLALIHEWASGAYGGDVRGTPFYHKFVFMADGYLGLFDGDSFFITAYTGVSSTGYAGDNYHLSIRYNGHAMVVFSYLHGQMGFFKNWPSDINSSFAITTLDFPIPEPIEKEARIENIGTEFLCINKGKLYSNTLSNNQIQTYDELNGYCPKAFRDVTGEYLTEGETIVNILRVSRSEGNTLWEHDAFVCVTNIAMYYLRAEASYRQRISFAGSPLEGETIKDICPIVGNNPLGIKILFWVLYPKLYAFTAHSDYRELDNSTLEAFKHSNPCGIISGDEMVCMVLPRSGISLSSGYAKSDGRLLTWFPPMEDYTIGPWGTQYNQRDEYIHETYFCFSKDNDDAMLVMPHSTPYGLLITNWSESVPQPIAKKRYSVWMSKIENLPMQAGNNCFFVYYWKKYFYMSGTYNGDIRRRPQHLDHSWERVDIPIDYSMFITAMCDNGTYGIIVTNTGTVVCRSTDGKTWTRYVSKAPVMAKGCRAILYGNGYFYAYENVGGDNIKYIRFPPDISQINYGIINDTPSEVTICFGNNLFVGVGTYTGPRGKGIFFSMVSPDFINWRIYQYITEETSICSMAHCLVFGDGVFYAGTNHWPDTILCTKDGFVWTTLRNHTSIDWHGPGFEPSGEVAIAYHDHRLFVYNNSKNKFIRTYEIAAA